MKNIIFMLFVFLAISSCSNDSNTDNLSDTVIYGPELNATAPASTVRMIFIHHSTGSAWIATGNGNLGTALNNSNFYVTEADYTWDAETDDNLGDRTDTGNWPEWFTDTKMPYVYANSSHYDYLTNNITDPGGENEIIMFKSCYPNSEVGSGIDDEKAIYNGLLTYFAAHPDRMFVLVIPPPERIIDSAALTRELSNWLVDRENGWLANYAYNNVFAFNYYNVLTDPNNHHWINNGREENVVSAEPVDTANPDELYYPSADDHPNSTGHQKATAEFVPLLIGWYNLWKGN